MSDRMCELKSLLLAWRKAEKDHAVAVLTSALPDEKSKLKDASQRAIHALRKFVDSEPWPDL